MPEKHTIDSDGNIQIPDDYVKNEADALLGENIYERLDDEAASFVKDLPATPDISKDKPCLALIAFSFITPNSIKHDPAGAK